MSLYGDKITINEEAGSDNLSASSSSGIDQFDFNHPLGSFDYDFNEDINLDVNTTTDKYNFNR